MGQGSRRRCRVVCISGCQWGAGRGCTGGSSGRHDEAAAAVACSRGEQVPRAATAAATATSKAGGGALSLQQLRRGAWPAEAGRRGAWVPRRLCRPPVGGGVGAGLATSGGADGGIQHGGRAVGRRVRVAAAPADGAAELLPHALGHCTRHSKRQLSGDGDSRQTRNAVLPRGDTAATYCQSSSPGTDRCPAQQHPTSLCPSPESRPRQPPPPP